jgi:hypothetical protein
MNSYAETLKTAGSEIDRFAVTEEGRKWDADWYDGLKARIDRTIAAKDDDASEELLDTIGWIIVDSGPMGEGFSDSIERALDAMQRARKQRAKAKRITEQSGGEVRG